MIRATTAQYGPASDCQQRQCRIHEKQWERGETADRGPKWPGEAAPATATDDNDEDEDDDEDDGS